MSTATIAVVVRVLDAFPGRRFLLAGGVTVTYSAAYGRYACLTCRVNDCPHTRAAVAYEMNHE